MRKLLGGLVLFGLLAGLAPSLAQAGYKLQWYNCESPQAYIATNVMNLLHAGFWLIPRLFLDEDLAPSYSGELKIDKVAWSLEALKLGIRQRTNPVEDLNAVLHFGCIHLERLP